LLNDFSLSRVCHLVKIEPTLIVISTEYTVTTAGQAVVVRQARGLVHVGAIIIHQAGGLVLVRIHTKVITRSRGDDVGGWSDGKGCTGGRSSGMIPGGRRLHLIFVKSVGLRDKRSSHGECACSGNK
jgi:hypothetical protein